MSTEARKLIDKYMHNLSIIGNKIVAYTTEQVYLDVRNVPGQDEIYVFPIGKSYYDGKYYYILFNKSKIKENYRLKLYVPHYVVGMFIGKIKKDIFNWKKELGFRYIKIKKFTLM